MVTWLDRVAAVVGFGLLIYGIGRLSLEAGFIAAGALLLTGALRQRTRVRKREEEPANE